MNKKWFYIGGLVGVILLVVAYFMFLQPYTFASEALKLNVSVPKSWKVTKSDDSIDQLLWMQSISKEKMDQYLQASTEKEVLLFHGQKGVGNNGDKGFFLCVTRKDDFQSPATVKGYLDYIKGDTMTQDTYFNGSQFQQYREEKIGDQEVLTMDMTITQCNVLKNYRVSAYEEGEYFVGIYTYVEHEEDWPEVENVIKGWHLGE